MSKQPAFIPQEVAFRGANGDWRRRTIRTRSAFNRFTGQMSKLDREWNCRDEYSSSGSDVSSELASGDDTNAYGFCGTHTTDAAF